MARRLSHRADTSLPRAVHVRRVVSVHLVRPFPALPEAQKAPRTMANGGAYSNRTFSR